MMINDYIRVSVREPGSTHQTTRSVQDRMMFEFRNKGFGLFLNAYMPHPPAANGGGSPAAAIAPLRCAHPIVVETISQLKAVHRPAYVYDIALRRSYHIPTFQTFLGIVADPQEPFWHISDAQDHREFCHWISREEREWMEDWKRVNYPPKANSFDMADTGLPRPVLPDGQLRVDCVAISRQCAALVTSCNELSEKLLVDTAALGHVAHALLGNCQQERYKARWGKFFQQRALPPRLYIGVGPSEFGDGNNVVESAKLTAMAHRATSVERPPPPSERTTTIPARMIAVARHLGITLLQRHEMRYFVLR